MAGYRALWLTGWLWHIARWMVVFTTSYRVNEQTGDPLLVQLTGTFFMAPMFLGGALAGTLTDRFDRRRTVASVLGVLVPLSAAMALLVSAGKAPVAVSYAFVFLVGAGNVTDMVSRRSIAFGLAGTALLTNAAALESFALHAGNMTGSFLGGALLEARDAAFVYATVAGVYVVALAAFFRSGRQVAAEPPAPPSSTSVAADLAAAFGLLREHTVLRQFLMTTVLMNFFYYAFMPLIPAFADELGVGALATGVLASALGMGTMTGSFVISRIQPSHRGLLHVAGSAGAMIMLALFANMTWYPAALACLFIAGLSGSGFGTTQAALVVSLVDDAVRGRALGVLSMAIGALPFGMFSLGLVARRTEPRLAVTLSVAVGLTILVAWHGSRRHLRRLA